MIQPQSFVWIDRKLDQNVSIYNDSVPPEEPSGISREEYIYTVLTAVTSALSVFGGICICALYLTFKDVRTPVRKLLLFLAISDSMLALGNFLGVMWYLYRDYAAINRNKAYCAFQSAMTIYFSMTSFYWTVVMGMCLLVSTVLNNPAFTPTYMKIFHLFAWIPAGVIVVTALSMDVLGQDPTLRQASWCWINTRVDHVLVWQLMTGKLWEIIAYVTTVVLYTIIKVFLFKRAKRSLLLRGRRTRTMLIQEANVKLTFVPLVFIVCRMWGTLRFLLGNFAHDHINEPYVTWINPLQGIGDSAQGFMNFLLYCISTNKIRHRLVRCFCPSKSAPTTTTAAGNHTGLETQSKALKRSTVDIANESQTVTGVAATGQPSTSNTVDSSFSHPT